MMSTKEIESYRLVGWGAREGFMEDVTCELRHEGAHPAKGDEGQREDVQSHTGLKSMACLGLFKSLMMAECQVREMKVGETWQKLKL